MKIRGFQSRPTQKQLGLSKLVRPTALTRTMNLQVGTTNKVKTSTFDKSFNKMLKEFNGSGQNGKLTVRDTRVLARRYAKLAKRDPQYRLKNNVVKASAAVATASEASDAAKTQKVFEQEVDKALNTEDKKNNVGRIE